MAFFSSDSLVYHHYCILVLWKCRGLIMVQRTMIDKELLFHQSEISKMKVILFTWPYKSSRPCLLNYKFSVAIRFETRSPSKTIGVGNKEERFEIMCPQRKNWADKAIYRFYLPFGCVEKGQQSTNWYFLTYNDRESRSHNLKSP